MSPARSCWPQFCERLCASLDKVHRDRGIRCDLDLAADVALRADEGDLFELFGNLLENAYRHCRSRVRVSARMLDDQLQVDVEDDGDGIAAEDVTRLLQRGERADQRHPGEGIGLAVVSEIITQYGGTFNVGPLRPRRGGCTGPVPSGQPPPHPTTPDNPCSSTGGHGR